MTSLESYVGFLIFSVVLTGILYVLFGQITVRKLRKIPATKTALGAQFVSGWDILNTASALSSPRWLRKKLSSSPLHGLSANYEVLFKYTNQLDRILARVFWFLYLFTSGSMVILVIAHLADIV